MLLRRDLELYHVSVVLMLILVSTAVRGDEVPISVVSGVYWKPIPHALVYESTMPLFYRSFSPAVDSVYYRKNESGISFCKMLISPECILFGWIKQADKRIGLQMSWLNTSIGEDAFSLNSISVRNKRSLHFIGCFMIWCCGVATTRDLRPLFYNDKQLKKYDLQLQQGLKGAFSKIDSVVGNFSDYGAEMEKMFSQIDEDRVRKAEKAGEEETKQARKRARIVRKKLFDDDKAKEQDYEAGMF
ncbi:hypothetical protein J6590_060654 [Homalodisca vitripennis]|nr:hypothetical protein J6590_060654 [Homalodisca vitripennis]